MHAELFRLEVSWCYFQRKKWEKEREGEKHREAEKEREYMQLCENVNYIKLEGEDMYDTTWTLDLFIHFVLEILLLGNNQKLSTKGKWQAGAYSLYGTLMYEFNWKQVVCTEQDTHPPIQPYDINKSWLSKLGGFCWLGCCQNCTAIEHMLWAWNMVSILWSSTTNTLTSLKARYLGNGKK